MFHLSPAQIKVLYVLRHTASARFSTLMHTADMPSDTFKFHLRKLTKLGYVQKLPTGEYALTATGKEFSNNLGEQDAQTQRQPKLSLQIIARRTVSGQEEFLLQQRKRHPFYDFWGCIGGAVQWGESFEATAGQELLKQTGLTATFMVRSFYRKRDFLESSEALLEDKLFINIEAETTGEDPHNTWAGGINKWMSTAELTAQPAYFASTLAIVTALQDKIAYQHKDFWYDQSEY